MEIWKEKTHACRMIGNAFPPPVAYAVGKEIRRVLENGVLTIGLGYWCSFFSYRFFCMDNFSSSLPDHYTHLSCIFEPSLTMFRFQPLTNMRLPLWIYLQEPAILIQVSPLAARPCSFFMPQRLFTMKFFKLMPPADHITEILKILNSIRCFRPYAVPIHLHTFFLYSNEYRIIIPSLLDVQ